MGFTPIMVLLRDAEHLSQLQKLVPHSCLMYVGLDWSSVSHSGTNLDNKNAAIFIDGKTTLESIRMAETMKMHEASFLLFFLSLWAPLVDFIS